MSWSRVLLVASLCMGGGAQPVSEISGHWINVVKPPGEIHPHCVMECAIVFDQVKLVFTLLKPANGVIEYGFQTPVRTEQSSFGRTVVTTRLATWERGALQLVQQLTIIDPSKADQAPGTLTTQKVFVEKGRLIWERTVNRVGTKPVGPPARFVYDRKAQ